jgi:hypothetical protein
MNFSKKTLVIICGSVILLGLLIVVAIFKLKPILPPTKKIIVPFTSQAPQGNWQEPWQNACEEASIVMIQNFYKNEGLTPAKARQQILEVFTLKKITAPASKDESLERIVEIINSGDLNWQARVVDNPSLTIIKDELAANHPVIAPVYAPMLGNPKYTGSGSDYHVIVITGYDDASSEFITNDPGTKDGKNYRYTYKALLAALHDYLTNKDYLAGAKRVLFTAPR